MSEYQDLIERYEREDRRALDDAVRAVLHTAEGRRVLRAICETTHVYDTLNVAHLEYQAGIHNVGLKFLAKANEIAPDMVLQSMQERNEIMRERNIRLKAVSEKERNGKREY